MTNHRGWMLVSKLQPGMRVRLKKAHPCGSYEWIVVEVKGDIRLDCVGCGRRVILPRRRLANRIREILPARVEESKPPLISLEEFLQLRQEDDDAR